MLLLNDDSLLLRRFPTNFHSWEDSSSHLEPPAVLSAGRVSGSVWATVEHPQPASLPPEWSTVSNSSRPHSQSVSCVVGLTNFLFAAWTRFLRLSSASDPGHPSHLSTRIIPSVLCWLLRLQYPVVCSASVPVDCWVSPVLSLSQSFCLFATSFSCKLIIFLQF